VIGRVWATAKDPTLEARKILLVRPIQADGVSAGEAFLAIDAVDAGFGERVLVVDEGGCAGLALGMADPPIRTVIVGVVDAIEMFR
jgi:microcompartment protein CcmK/EutM